MKRIPIFLALIYLGVISAFSQNKTDAKLTSKLQELVKGFQGNVGVYVQNLKPER